MFQVDLDRVAVYSETGIFVRAQDADGKWGSHDIAHLTPESLLAWLRNRGGHNQIAENVVGILLGHGHITEYPQEEVGSDGEPPRPPPHYKIVPTFDGGPPETRRVNGWIIDIDAKILWDTQGGAIQACKEHARRVAEDPTVQIEIIQPKPKETER